MANHSHPVPRAYLVDGYISFTFGFQTAERYMDRIFKLDSSSVVAAFEKGAFYIFNHPSCYNSPTLVYGQNTWLVDYSASRWPRGPVVPQQILLPQGEGERKTFVDDAQFRVLAFFVNMDWSQRTHHERRAYATA